jgi:hypothetical protein
MKSKSFYLDEQHSREIKIQWKEDLSVVDIFDGDELIHQHEDIKQIKKGIVLPTPKGENLYLRLFENPVRWEVLFGEQYLINSYKPSLEALKGTSQIFYYVFLASLMYLLVLVVPSYKLGQLDQALLLQPEMIIYYLLIILFYLCSILVKRGMIAWYFLGTSIYILDTIAVFLNTFIISDLPFEMLLKSNMGYVIVALYIIRIVFVYYLIAAFKHVVAYRKNLSAERKNRNDEILDI